MKTLSLDMFQTLAVAVLVLFLGAFLKKKIRLLETFCIPTPVVGGLVFAVFTCLLFVTGILEVNFDETMKTVCMVLFFTSVGFQANLKVLKLGEKPLLVFLLLAVILIFAQNALAVGLSNLIHVDPLVGMCTGSISMVGGHGTAGSFGQTLHDLGLESAKTLSAAAATFGLVAGSLIGGPLSRRLIERNQLMDTVSDVPEDLAEQFKPNSSINAAHYEPAIYQLVLAMGLGTFVSYLLSKTGMNFPIYIGAMIVAAVMRNLAEFTGKFTIYMHEIEGIGSISLKLFLGIAMITLKLWQLAEMAGPLVILLGAQVLLMAFYAYFVVFRVMGRTYDAAVLTAGICGFGMGATPNAMANMQAVTEKYAPSVQAFILVPIVGSLFADFLNSVIVAFFINLL